MEQPGPQQLPRRRPACGERAGQGSLGAGSQVRSGEEARAPPGGPRGGGVRAMEDPSFSKPRQRGSPGRRPVAAPAPSLVVQGGMEAPLRTELRSRPPLGARGPGAAAPAARSWKRLGPFGSPLRRTPRGQGLPRRALPKGRASGLHARQAHARGRGPATPRLRVRTLGPCAHRGFPKTNKRGLSCGSEKRATR